MSTPPRGLTVLISDLRNCATREQEEKRVQKELANIRGKFTSGKSLDSYNKKKYAWKLVYIFMLGFEVDFGHLEIINLLSGNSFAEKQVGYLAISVLMKNTDEMMTLIVNSIRNDLKSVNEYHQCLALCAVANIGGRELSDALVGDVQRILVSPSTPVAVRKKAALCLLRLYRTDTEIVSAEEWAPNLISLLDNPNLGVATSVMGLMLTLIARQGPTHYKGAMSPAIRLLGRLAMDRSCTPDYQYHHMPNPWLQVKLLRLLQFLPKPKSGSEMDRQLTLVLNAICSRVNTSKSVNKNNAEHSVLFEAVNLIIHYGEKGDATLREKAVTLLGRFVSATQANIRYLGLATMSRLAHMAKREGLEDVSSLIQVHQDTVLASLKDNDISIRRRALDLMFAMCTHSNSVKVVRELLQHLTQAEFGIKEEMVLKIAILAERYASDQRWYLDTILQLITIAGDYVSDEIWHRLIQIVTNNESVQRYAAAAMYRTLLPPHVHETATKVSAYVLGEFGYLLTEPPENGEDPGLGEGVELISSHDLFGAIHKHFLNSSSKTRRMLLHAYIKLVNLYTELGDQIQEVFESYKDSLDAELQQRACEYAMLPTLDEEKLQYVLDPMPPFPEHDASNVEQKLNEKSSESATVALDTEFSMRSGTKSEYNSTTEPTGLLNSHESGADSDHSSDDGGRGVDTSDDDDDDFSSAGASSRGLGQTLQGERMRDSDAEDGDSSTDDEEDCEENKVVDLLGMDESPKHVPAAAPIPNASSSLLGSSSNFDNASAGPPLGIKAELLPKMKEWFLASLRTPRCLLYEDDVVQIGVQHQYQASQGKLMFFIGNKLNQELSELMFAIPIPNATFRVKQEPTPPTIGPLLQCKLPIMLECMVPFDSPPELDVSFTASTSGQKYLYQLRLPVATTTFMQPITMDPSQFQPRWEAIGGLDKESKSSFAFSSIPQNEWSKMIHELKAICTALRLNIVSGGDASNPFTVYLAGTMCTGTLNSQTNKKVSVGCLARIDLDPGTGSCHVTVRAMNGVVALGTRNVLQQQIVSLATTAAAGSW